MKIKAQGPQLTFALSCIIRPIICVLSNISCPGPTATHMLGWNKMTQDMFLVK